MKMYLDVSDGKNIFFTSDFHLFHKNIIKFDKRPFHTKEGEPDLDAMHETIINNWNSVVKDNDIVFYMGDLCFSKWQKAKPLMDRLKKRWNVFVVPLGNSSSKKLRAALCQVQTLTYLDVSRTFVVHSDANNVEMGATLSQADASNQLCLLNAASRKCHSAKKNYPTVKTPSPCVVRWIADLFFPITTSAPFQAL